MIKKTLLLTLFIVSNLIIFAQDRQIKKLKKFYNQEKYKKCIEKSDKVSDKYPKKPLPLYYNSFSNFQLYKTSSKLKKKYYLQNTINNIKLGLMQDKDSVFFTKFPVISAEIKDTTINFARKIFDDEKGSAEFFFESIAIIYNDTLPEYKKMTQPENVKIQQNLAFKENKGPINETDIEGNRQGRWVKKYPDGIVRYEIYFKNNHPAGVYRKYYPNGNLKADMYFNENGTIASAILFNKKGQKIAMGYYKNKQKDSLWQYFLNDSIVISQENYKNGLKHGKEVIYSLKNYPNPLEEKFWKNGNLDSTWTRFYQNGNPKFIANYKDSIRNGKYILFDENGTKKIIGYYKNNLPEGKWNYWDDSTKTYITIEYQKGVPVNNQKITEYETNVIENMEKMKGKIEEPEKQIMENYGGNY